MLTSDICKDLGGFEAKVCLSEVGNFEEDVRQAMTTADVNQMCQTVYFCDA